MYKLGAVSMRNVWLIARREYVERIRTRGFVITTVLIPVLMVGFAAGSVLLGAHASGTTRLALVSSDPRLALDLQTELQREQPEQSPATDSGAGPTPTVSTARPSHIEADVIQPGADTRADLVRDLDADRYDAFLWITPASGPGLRPTFTLTSRSSAQSALKSALSAALIKVLGREQLNGRGIASEDAERILEPVRIATAKLPHHAERESAQLSVSVLFFVMYLVIMLYGMNVARSIIEEKTSRIFEVLLATVRPEAMMAGKIIGVGSVGLTQVGIWIGAASLLAGASMALHLGGEAIQFSLAPEQVIFFFVFFILGYLFYASIAAAMGAMTNSEQELQQLNMFLVMPLLLCFVLLGSLLTAPDSTLARILALAPPFTPLLMYLRVCLGHPAAWEVALSLWLTAASICVVIWITSRIYRIGVLMYGKRPNLPEILRWLKYS